jgi:hypothetical protein
MMTFIKILGALAAGVVVISGAVILYVVVGLALGVKEEEEKKK